MSASNGPLMPPAAFAHLMRAYKRALVGGHDDLGHPVKPNSNDAARIERFLNEAYRFAYETKQEASHDPSTTEQI